MTIQRASFIALLTLVTLAFFGLLADFLQPVFWAATLAILFQPVQRYFLSVLGDRSALAAFATLVLILVVAIIPTIFVASAVLREAADFYARIQSGAIDPGRIIEWARDNAPRAIAMLERVGITTADVRDNLSSAAIRSSQFMGSLAIAAGQNLLRFTLMLFLMLYVLYFLIRDGEMLLEYIVNALPLGNERERALMAKFAEVSRATVKGTLVIGLIQGALGGLIFAILGIRGAVFWGAVMVILSLLPVVGASLVWLPAAIFMAANGLYVQATVLVLFGVLVIGLIDNVLRPILVGRDTRMPDYLVLLSTLGGLTIFGVSGFVIGPVIAALFLSMWVMFAEENVLAGQPAPAESPAGQSGKESSD